MHEPWPDTRSKQNRNSYLNRIALTGTIGTTGKCEHGLRVRRCRPITPREMPWTWQLHCSEAGDVLVPGRCSEVHRGPSDPGTRRSDVKGVGVGVGRGGEEGRRARARACTVQNGLVSLTDVPRGERQVSVLTAACTTFLQACNFSKWKAGEEIAVPGSSPVPAHRGETGALELSPILQRVAATGPFPDLIVCS